MIPNPRPEAESGTPNYEDIESSELSDQELIDAFCDELLAALTELERSPGARSAKAGARFN